MLVVTVRVPADADGVEFAVQARAESMASSPGFLRAESYGPDADTADAVVIEQSWWIHFDDFASWRAAHASESEAWPTTVRDVLASSDLRPDAAVPHVLDPQQLARFDGAAGSRILIAVDGAVFDVSSSAGFYGPGGTYHALAGCDATRALAHDDLALAQRGSAASVDSAALDGAAQTRLDEWLVRFESKYARVGFLRGHEPAAGASPTRSSAPKRQPRVVRRVVRYPEGHPMRARIDAQRSKL